MQKGQTGKGVAMLMIKARGPKKMAAYNAFKVAEWIGDFARCEGGKDQGGETFGDLIKFGG